MGGAAEADLSWAALDERASGELSGQTVAAVALRVFPPFAEDRLDAADIGLALGFDDGRWCEFQVRPATNWGVEMRWIARPRLMSWAAFEQEMPRMLAGAFEPDYEHRYYEATGAAEFASIVGARVDAIECLACGGAVADPFGVRIGIGDDYVLVYPNTDGSMVETRSFKPGRGLGEFETLGGLPVRCG